MASYNPVKVKAPAHTQAVVNVFKSDGVTQATVYTDATAQSTITIPYTIAVGGTQSFFVADDASGYVVSCLVNGIEYANGDGTRWSGVVTGGTANINPGFVPAPFTAFQNQGYQLQLPYQAPAYAATITVDANLGSLVNVGTLTGNTTIAAPINPINGQYLTFVFTQDATGGRTVTWNAVFKVSWTPTTTASKVNSIEFFYNGTNWVQLGSAVGL